MASKEVLDLEPLKKWESFNFDVSEINGHDIKKLKDLKRKVI